MVAARDKSGIFEPVRKVIRVALPVEEAFKLFTEGMSSWWPLDSHSVGGDKTARCVFEANIGGRIYEVQEDGTEAMWGVVSANNPPHQVSFTWYPGRTKDTAQDVEVSFKAIEHGTELTLLHHGWELLGDAAEETRAGYDSGWDFVLGEFIQGSRA